MCYNTGVAQGYSSAGRVPVSKTVGRGFESSCPCHVVWSKKLIRTRKTALWQAKRRKTGDFERFLPFFSSLLFFEKIPIHISNNQEYRELQHRQSQNKAELLEVLSDEQKELLENFCATEIEPNGISEREAFTAGFKIAMRLAAEAFYEADNE